jgi:hypothetical protein
VRWPAGETESWAALPVDRYSRIFRGKGVAEKNTLTRREAKPWKTRNGTHL